MRILILSVTAGYGHHSTANALAEELERREIDVTVMDLYRQASKFMYDVVDKGYTFSIKHLRRQFGKAYNTLTENENARNFVNIISGNKRIARKFAAVLQGYKPDVIISTHVLAAQIIDILKAHGFVTVPVFGIVTDYCIHPFWEDVTSIDYIITGSEHLNYVSEKRGINPLKLLPLGLPVRAVFSNHRDKSELRTELNLEEKKTILVMGGSMGYGNIMQSISEIDNLDLDIQIICICGNNTKLYQRMQSMRTKSKLLTLGFVNNVEQYMGASDCIVTKPGGLTVTEAMCMRLPMILVNPIPGHEEYNAEFLTNYGVAVRVTEQFSLSEAVYLLFKTEGRLELMERSIELLARPDATERICDAAIMAAERNSRIWGIR